MSQNNATASFPLGQNQAAAALEFNRKLGLQPDSIRILQHVLCVKITGEFDEATVHALNQRDYNEVFIKNFLARKLRERGQSLPTTWENIVALLKTSAQSGLLRELSGELGKLHEEVFWWVLNGLLDQQAFDIAVTLAADYIGEDLAGKAWFYRYKADLDHAYTTQVAGEKILVMPDKDSQRVNGVFKISQTAPHNLLMAYFGPKAFASLDSLRTAIKHALAVEVANMVPASTSTAAPADALKKNAVFFAHPRYVKAVQLAVGAPVSGKMDETTVRFIAQFQSRNGLGADGVIGKGQTLPRMIRRLQELDLPETAVLLIMGYFNMWLDEHTHIFYYPQEPNAKVIVNQNIEGLDFIAIGKTAFSGPVDANTIDAYARVLYPTASPLAEYAGSRFTGKKALVHRAFFPLLDRVHAYAEKHNLFLQINDSFRVEGAVVSGAIVTPAKRSNHHAGFAIDYNFVLGDSKRVIHSSELKNNEASWPKSVQGFLKDVRDDASLRWEIGRAHV